MRPIKTGFILSFSIIFLVVIVFSAINYMFVDQKQDLFTFKSYMVTSGLKNTAMTSSGNSNHYNANNTTLNFSNTESLGGIGSKTEKSTIKTSENLVSVGATYQYTTSKTSGISPNMAQGNGIIFSEVSYSGSKRNQTDNNSSNAQSVSIPTISGGKNFAMSLRNLSNKNTNAMIASNALSGSDLTDNIGLQKAAPITEADPFVSTPIADGWWILLILSGLYFVVRKHKKTTQI